VVCRQAGKCLAAQAGECLAAQAGGCLAGQAGRGMSPRPAPSPGLADVPSRRGWTPAADVSGATLMQSTASPA
jgi:hypothetical protein